MRAKLEIDPLGDCALLLRVRDNAAAIALQRQIETTCVPGVVECIAAFDSLGVFVDTAAAAKMDEIIQHLRTISNRVPRRAAAPPRPVEVAACFDPEFGIDIHDVADRAALSCDELVALFCATEFRVACIGFTPGFPYLAGLPQRLCLPRRATPRQEVPAGSVAIGGTHAGIYPTNSPGGWNLIGRTSLKMFDPHAAPPAAFEPGDLVRFRAVPLQEFRAMV